MVTITPKEYCVILHPVKRNAEGGIVEEHGQVLLNYGEEEYRFAQTPFPLYPGEVMEKEVKKLTVLPPNKALLLSAIIAFKDDNGVDRVPGENWLFEGPGKSSLLILIQHYLCIFPLHPNYFQASTSPGRKLKLSPLARLRWLWQTLPSFFVHSWTSLERMERNVFMVNNGL